MSLVRAVLASARGRIVLGALALYLAFQAWQTLAAPGKVAPVLAAATARRLNVTVTLPFPPERFHVLAFQRFGRVAGTEENAVELRGVAKENLTALARPYWVVRVDPMDEGG
jgi:hypothetical protein